MGEHNQEQKTADCLDDYASLGILLLAVSVLANLAAHQRDA